MKLSFSLVCLVLTILLTSCVSQKKYKELEDTLNYYKTEALLSDSLNNNYLDLTDKNRETEGELRVVMNELEQLTATNLSLNRSYQEILAKYNALVDQSREMLTTTSYEKLSLQEQLAAQQAALDDKERNVADLEFELYQKEDRLNTVEYSYNELEGDITSKNRRIRELEALVGEKDESMTRLRARLNELLRGFSSADLSVTEKNGKLYVSLSQNLLFRSGSTSIDYKGKKAIQQLAKVLNEQPDVEITVEGHTDASGRADRNWDLSVTRATAVVKLLTQYKVDPKRITASGRALYDPISSNVSSSGKARNRRTEIILSPNLDELYEIVSPSNN